MNEPVDLTKCQPGDLLEMRNGSRGLYLGYYCKDAWPHLVRCDAYGEYGVDASGKCYNQGEESSGDVVAIIHPTRAELEEQRWELLEALKLANERGVACGMDIAYPDAHREIRFAIEGAEATHE